MKPYYESWLSSTHAKVNCIDCHYDQGLAGYWAGKLRLAGEVARYWVGAYNVRPHSRVSDQNCLRCHPGKDLEKTATYRQKIPFSHVKHYGNPTRGIEMTCTTCHSQLVQGNHLAIDDSACILCHFTGVARGESVSRCHLCHGPPKDQITVRGVVFHHSEYLKSGVDCMTCHVHVTRGTGDVPREKCYSCHVEHFEEFGKTELMHQTHITEQKLKCTDCHSALEHGKIELAQALSPDCSTCHGSGRHSVQEEIYIGIGGSGVETQPDPMFLASVTCTACHQSRHKPNSPMRTVISAATPESCVNCHGTGYDRLMKQWQAHVSAFLKDVQSQLTVIERRLKVSSSVENPQAQTLYEEARTNLALVQADQSFGVHNIHYIDRLLKRSEENLARAGAVLEGKELLVSKALHNGIRYGCTSCHVGVENLPMTQTPSASLHQAHLRKNDCNACHLVSPNEHGRTLVAAQDCTSCHLPAKRMAALEPKDCLQCHPEPTPPSAENIHFPHDFHVQVGITCANCHLKVHQMDHLDFMKTERAGAKFSHSFCATCHKKDLPPGGGQCTKCHLKL
jgi:hypothetical protein